MTYCSSSSFQSGRHASVDRKVFLKTNVNLLLSNGNSENSGKLTPFSYYPVVFVVITSRFTVVWFSKLSVLVKSNY